MMWSLFLDDERFPVMKGEDDDWVIIRTAEEALLRIEELGYPRRMSLDHDLGEGIMTGYDFIRGLVDFALDGNMDWGGVNVKDIDVYVHSQNPVGAENIRKYWENFMRFDYES